MPTSLLSGEILTKCVVQFIRSSRWCTARRDEHWRRWASSVSGKQPLQSIEDVATYIKHQASNILVMVGAGMSTPSGIPDFRSVYYV